MGVPVLRTWFTGEVANAAELNANIRDPLQFFLNRPYLFLTNTANVSIPASASTLLSWNTELADTDGMHNTLSNPARVTVVTPGLYDIEVLLLFAGTATTDSTSRAVQIRLNAGGSSTGGTRITDNRSTSATSAITGQTDTIESTVQVSAYQFLNIGDTVEFFAFQDTAGALNLLCQASGDMWTYATMRWVASS